MTGFPASCHTVSSEGQAYHSDSRDARVDGDNSHSTNRWIPAGGRTKWTYFLLGCATFLPWNVLLNGMSFFLSRMAGSPFYSTFASYLSSTYTLTKLVCQLYFTITSEQSSPSRRIFLSVISMALLVTSLYLSTYIRGTPSTFFLFALSNTALLGASAGCLGTATYAVTALLGPSFLQIVLSGQGAVMTMASAVQVVSSVISLWGSSSKSVLEAKTAGGRGDQPEEAAARIFFGVFTSLLGVTLVAYTWLSSRSFYKSATRSLELRWRGVGDADELTGLMADDPRSPQIGTRSRIYQVFKKNFVFMFSIAFVPTVTLSVFPVITARVQPVTPTVHPLLFTAAHTFVVNTGDLLGRYSCSFSRLLVWSEKKILVISILRMLFIPLILLCNVHRPATIRQISPIINSDIAFMIILLAIGYTQGFVSCIATLVASSLEHNPRLNGREDVDTVATLCGFFTVLGLAAGALCSFGVQAVV